MKKISWYLQESNQGHKDFQSFALPTELRYQLFCFASANIETFLQLTKQISRFYITFYTKTILIIDFQSIE